MYERMPQFFLGPFKHSLVSFLLSYCFASTSYELKCSRNVLNVAVLFLGDKYFVIVEEFYLGHSFA